MFNAIVKEQGFEFCGEMERKQALTALWTDPLNGIFTFMDSNFAGIETAGAPRWKP